MSRKGGRVVRVGLPHEGRSGWDQMLAAYGRQGAAWVRLYIRLLARAGRPKIKLHQGKLPPYCALRVSRITGPAGPSIR